MVPKIYSNFKNDGTTQFNLYPAIFKAGPKPECVEENNCDWEKMTLCTFTLTDLNGKMAFLQCMDSLDAYSYTAITATKKCVATAKVKVNYTNVDTCFQGEQGDKLLQSAAQRFSRLTRASVPQAFVGTSTVDPDDNAYETVLALLCANGSKAKACTGDNDNNLNLSRNSTNTAEVRKF